MGRGRMYSWGWSLRCPIRWRGIVPSLGAACLGGVCGDTVARDVIMGSQAGVVHVECGVVVTLDGGGTVIGPGVVREVDFTTVWGSGRDPGSVGVDF